MTQCCLRKTMIKFVRAHLIKLSGFQHLPITDLVFKPFMMDP
jgi:hypothetical protein